MMCVDVEIENIIDHLYDISQRKVIRPSYQELMLNIKDLGYVGTGKKYNVSDNAIRKWKKYYEKNN
jgi:hypothetical protein